MEVRSQALTVFIAEKHLSHDTELIGKAAASREMVSRSAHKALEDH